MLWSALLSRRVGVSLRSNLSIFFLILRWAHYIILLFLWVKYYIVFANNWWTSIWPHVLRILWIISFILGIFFKHIINFIHILLINLSIILRVLPVSVSKGSHDTSALCQWATHVFIHAHFDPIYIELLCVCLNFLSAHVIVDMLVRYSIWSF
jgi:hypothetical protein